MPVCKACRAEKHPDDFYKNHRMSSGLDSKCKECKKMEARAHRANNLEKYRAYDRERASDPKRVEARKAYALTEEGKAAAKRAKEKYAKVSRREYLAKWRASLSPEQLERQKESKRRYMRSAKGLESQKRTNAKNRDRRDARIKAANAIRSGALIPWPICSMPCCDKKPEAHHADYSRPLDVVWLCREHHIAAHYLGRSLSKKESER